MNIIDPFVDSNVEDILKKNCQLIEVNYFIGNNKKPDAISPIP